VAGIGDLHCSRTSAGTFQPIFARAAEEAQVLALCGDLTNHGMPEEARVLARELTASVNIPTVAVLGNHDYEMERAHEIRHVLEGAGVNILDGEAVELAGVGFAGIKGFAGGFGRYALAAWGEQIIKAFVREAIEEMLKLESALLRLQSSPRLVLLHYSPIRGTAEGESPEIFAYLGSSRLEEPLNRYPVDAVMHGHAHGGRLEGRTSAGVPVYNVSLPLLRASRPGQPPYRTIELELSHPHVERSS